MSTDDQKRSAVIHGEALLAAQSEEFRPVLERMAAATDDPTLRAQVAGMLAGDWFANPDRAELGRQLIAAGLLITSGVTDYDRLGEVVREYGEQR